MASIFNKSVVYFYILVLVLFSHAYIAISATVNNTTARNTFKQWMAQHEISYPDESEEEKRFGIFLQNLQYIENFNNAGNQTYELGLNEFSDLSVEEFRLRTGGGVIGSDAFNFSTGQTTPYRFDICASKVPASINWVAKGALNSIQSQGMCACCWAFAATAAMEAVIKIKYGVMKKLSEQQLVDCDHISHGCNGGWFQSAYQYVLENGGISSESEYPYVGKQGACRAAPSVAKINGWKNLPENNEAEILKAVVHQPVTVLINGLSVAFKSYRGGIFSSNGCTDKLDHAVAIVGYGTSPEGTKYWLLRNSWGTSWGEGGYMRIAREIPGRPQGACGLAINVAIPY